MNLKQEMRQRFEKHPSMDFNDRNSGFEDGLLEKIINLSFNNLRNYSSKAWSITAVKTPVQLQKLYRLTGDERITSSAIALLISSQTEGEVDEGRDLSGDLGLLLLSLTYAAKYYCIDTINITNFNSDLIVREFALDRSKRIAAVKCFGTFGLDISTFASNPAKRCLHEFKII